MSSISLANVFLPMETLRWPGPRLSLSKICPIYADGQQRRILGYNANLVAGQWADIGVNRVIL